MGKRYNNISDEAVENATGKTWDAWFALLDEAGAAEMSHKEIAALLVDDGYVARDDGWWAQTVTVGYEYEKGRRVEGRTRDAGFQVGVQKTIPVSAARAWSLMTSPEAMRIWLGTDAPDLTFEPGAKVETADGYRIEIRTVKDGERIRLRWQPPDRDEPTTLQVYLQDKDAKTAVRFHQEHLADSAERARMKRHWRDVLGRLQSLVVR